MTEVDLSEQELEEYAVAINKVNKEAVRLWVEALRSGDYLQGRGNLQRDGKYCCLGVACEVAIKAGVSSGTAPKVVFKRSFSGHHAPVRYFFSEDDWSETALPVTVARWFGFFRVGEGEGSYPQSDPIVEVRPNGVIHSIEANDDLRYTFEHIASALELTYLNEENADVGE